MGPHAALDPDNTSLQALVTAFNESQKRQIEISTALDNNHKWQRDMEAAVNSIAVGHNNMVASVNTLGKFVAPLIAETKGLKTVVRQISDAMQELMND